MIGLRVGAVQAAAYLAKPPTGEAAKSGPWGLAIILILCAACYFLFKSMSKHMRRVREQFPVTETKRRPQHPPARGSQVEQGDPMAREQDDQVRPDSGGDATGPAE